MMKRMWQETGEILSYFGRERRRAANRYLAFIEEGLKSGECSELGGGGLIRSIRGWSEVVSLRRRGIPMISGERILGSVEFVERVIAEADQRERQTLKLRRKVPELNEILKEAAEKKGIDEKQLTSSSRTRKGARAIKCPERYLT
jgi:putative transposase